MLIYCQHSSKCSTKLSKEGKAKQVVQWEKFLLQALISWLYRSQARRTCPSWSLRGRSDIGGFTYYNTKAGTPGPASYGPVKSSVYKRQTASAGFTIPGRNNNKDHSLNNNPGPGCYDTGDIGTTSTYRRGVSMGIRHSEFIVPLITNVDRVWIWLIDRSMRTSSLRRFSPMRIYPRYVLLDKFPLGHVPTGRSPSTLSPAALTPFSACPQRNIRI